MGQGTILNKRGKSDEAVSVFKKAIDINPHYAEAYEGLGLVYIHKKQEEDATQAFRKAIDINPGLVNSRYNLGILYAKRRNSTKPLQNGRRHWKLTHKRQRFVITWASPIQKSINSTMLFLFGKRH